MLLLSAKSKVLENMRMIVLIYIEYINLANSKIILVTFNVIYIYIYIYIYMELQCKCSQVMY